MSYGIACIATDVGGTPEVLDGKGLLISPKNVKNEIFSAITSLANNPKLRSEIGESAKTRAQLFKYQNVSDELKNFLFITGDKK